MTLTEEDLTEFKAIYKEQFNEELNDEDALREAQDFLAFFQAFLIPISEEALAKADRDVYEYWKQKFSRDIL